MLVSLSIIGLVELLCLPDYAPFVVISLILFPPLNTSPLGDFAHRNEVEDLTDVWSSARMTKLKKSRSDRLKCPSVYGGLVLPLKSASHRHL